MLAATVVSFVICGLALRSNYTTMTRLRTAVYTADEKNIDVVGALQRLRGYVNSHMNTSLRGDGSVYPPLQLTHTYERLQEAEQAKAAASNSQVYTDAQKHCEALFPNSVSGGPRVPCIEQYVKDHGGVAAQKIPEALYKFDFASPRWSPDFAGWSLVFSVMLLVLTILRGIAGLVLRRFTR